MKKLALSLLMVVSTCLSAQSADLTWINGVDVCTGNWSYTKLGYCGYKDDLSRPIPKTVYDISYTPNTCQHAKNDYDVVETTTGSVEWLDTPVAQSCAHLKPADLRGNTDIWVLASGIPVIEGPWNGSCTHRNAFNTCDSWHKVYRATCTFDHKVAKTKENADACGTTKVETPRTITIGYEKVMGFDRSCPDATSEKSARLINRKSFTDPSIDPSTFKCSTLDETPASSDGIIQKKFDAYMAEAFEVTALEGQCGLKGALAKGISEIANFPGSTGQTVLTEEQFDLAFIYIDALNTSCAAEVNAQKLLETKAELKQLIGQSEIVIRPKSIRSPDSLKLSQGRNGAEINLYISNRGSFVDIEFRADGTISETTNVSTTPTIYTLNKPEMNDFITKLISRVTRSADMVQESGPAESAQPLAALLNYLKALQSNFSLNP